MDSRLAKLVVVVIVGVWTITTVILPLALKGYNAPPEIGPVMGAVGGAAAAALFAKKGGDETKPPPKPPPKPRRRKDPPE